MLARITYLGSLTAVCLLAAVAILAADSDEAYAYESLASFYGAELAGNPTASGEPFNPGDFTVAHKGLPFGTKVLICNPANGACVTARVNDRGPYVGGREYDVSFAVAAALGTVQAGVAPLEFTILG